jgi:hypothetical protein
MPTALRNLLRYTRATGIVGDLSGDCHVYVGGPFLNPVARVVPRGYLDLGWHSLTEYFEPQELLMKQALIDKYFPHASGTARAAAPEEHA